MWNKFKDLIKDKLRNDSEMRTNFSTDIHENKKIIEDIFSNVGDLKLREVTLTDSSGRKIRVLLAYVDSLVEKDLINNNIIEPLNFQLRESGFKLGKGEKSTANIVKNIINVNDVKKINEIKQTTSNILQGQTVLLFEGSEHAYIIDTQGWKERSISPPEVESSVRGPRVAFMENINVNLGSIRRIIKSRSLKIEYFTKGRHSQTEIALLYMEGIANKKIVNEVKKRLQPIDIDHIKGCTHVMELIEDNPQSIFNTIYESERLDVITGGIMEGRICILTDNCPTALLLPKLFMENFISAEDYYSRYWYTLIIRVLRFVGFLVSTMLPAVYISIISFHQELVPLGLVETIYTSRKGVPFPIVIEMFLFLSFFEAIKESGTRIPSSLGNAISIVGALVLGQAAIAAGFLSADGVIIGSLTGIAIFVTPLIEFNNSLIIIRLLYIIAAGFMGFYGMTLFTFLITAHLCSLRSFGVPITSPIAPLDFQDLSAVFFRTPYLVASKRTEALETSNKTRQGNKPLKRYFFKFKLEEDGEENQT